MRTLSSFSTLQLALGASVLVHAVLITVRFVDPQRFDRVFQDTPLEVILVNAQGKEAPEKAQAIAQFNLAGGGEAAKGRATSPLPLSASTREGEFLDEDEARIAQMKERQENMLTQLRAQLAAMPPPDPLREKVDPAVSEREAKRRALVKLLAEIERRINEENARPRKRYISPATREAVYATYYDALRRRIEDRGTERFPESGGRKLYGELTMVITVNFDGRVLDTEVVQGSGQEVLDRRAQAIVEGLRFGRFQNDMWRKADQIVVVSRFRFTREATLQTQLGGE